MNPLYNTAVNPSQSITWPGLNGASYKFEHYPIGTVFNAVGGVYIFCKIRPDGRWDAVYVGETDNFCRRLTDELAAHHQWNAVCRAGATHVCALVVSGGNTERLRIETDLRHSLNPSCNRQ